MDKSIGLSKLLGKLSIEEFFNTYFDKEYYYLKRDNKSFYDFIIKLSDYDEILTSRNIPGKNIRIFNHGEYVEPENYTNYYGNVNFTSNEKIIDEYLKGSTIVLEQFHSYFYQLNLLCKNIQKELDSLIMMNTYITPANSYGFEAHYDTHSVMILQIHGTKRWHIYKNKPFELPTSQFRPIKDIDQTEYDEIDIQAGDLLYIPRGLAHKVFCQDSDSIHITVRINSLATHEYVNTIFEKIIEQHAGFRESIIHNLPDTKEIQKKLDVLIPQKFDKKTIAQELFQKLNTEDLFPIQKNRFANVLKINQVNKHSQIRIRNGIFYNIEVIDEKSFYIQFNRKKLRLPIELLESIQGLETIKTVDECFYNCDDDTQLGITNTLIKNGLIDVVKY